MTDQSRQAYAVCPGVTHVDGERVQVDTVWLTAAAAAFDLAHGRISRMPDAPGRRNRQRRPRKADVNDGD